MPIGAFGRAAGLSLKALRLYDRAGILLAAYTDPDSGYRYYGAEQVTSGRQIRLMRAVDMPLALIRQILTSRPQEAQRLIRGYQRSAAAHLTQVQRTTQALLCSWDKETTMTFEVETRDYPAAQVVSVTRKVKIGELGGFIGGSLEALSAWVKAQGGEVAGAPFGLYHGPVGHDDDGPVEVCFPVRGAFTAEGEIVVKAVPAQRAAVVTVQGEECRFPAILKAYDAAHDWVTGNGYEPDGASREVWIGPDEHGPIEVAWPFRTRA